MRAAKVQASLRIRAVSPEPPLLARTSSESRGTFRQKARSLVPLNGWACAVKICHDGMLEDTNSLDAVQLSLAPVSSWWRKCAQNGKRRSYIFTRLERLHFFTYIPLSNVVQLKQNGFTEMTNGHDSKVYDKILHFIMSQQNFRNYVVWPTFLLMNVFTALKGSHFWFLFWFIVCVF